MPSSPTGAACQAESAPRFTPQKLSCPEKLWHYQHIIRRWKKHMSDSEAFLLVEVCDRTIGWSRDWVVCQVNELAHAAGHSVRTTQRHIAACILRGTLIRQRKHGWSKYEYRVNFDWRPKPMALGNKHQLGQTRHSGLGTKYKETSRVTDAAPQGSEPVAASASPALNAGGLLRSLVDRVVEVHGQRVPNLGAA